MLLNSLVLLVALQSQLLATTTVLSQQQQTNQNQSQSQSNVSTQSNNSSNSQTSQQQQQQAALQLLLAPNTLASIANAAAAGSGAAGTVATSGQGQTNSPPNFVIKYDSKNNLAYVSILTPNQTNLHEPRIELRYQSSNPFIELSEITKINSVVAALIVNDEDPGPSGETSLFIESGNELGHFKLVSTQHSNTIQVANQLNIDLKQDYNLTIVARDHGSPPKSSSVNLVIKLTQAIPKPSNNHLHPDPAWDPSTNKAIFTDLMYFGAMLVVTFLTIILILILACFLTQGPNSKKGPPPRTTSTNTNHFELY